MRGPLTGAPKNLYEGGTASFLLKIPKSSIESLGEAWINMGGPRRSRIRFEIRLLGIENLASEVRTYYVTLHYITLSYDMLITLSTNMPVGGEGAKERASDSAEGILHLSEAGHPHPQLPAREEGRGRGREMEREREGVTKRERERESSSTDYYIIQ